MHRPDHSDRQLALDFLRGAAVCLLILVSCPGDWGQHAAQLRPTLSGRGFVLADLCQPMFLYISGASLWFSFVAQDARWSRPLLLKIGLRCLVFLLFGFLCDYVLDRFSGAPLQHPCAGIFQRISLSLVLAVTLARSLPRQGLLIVLVVMLLAHGYLGDSTSQTPIWGLGPLHQWSELLPATALVLLGWLNATFISYRKGLPNIIARDLALLGLGVVFLAVVWDLWYPITPGTWSSSYALLGGGMSLLILATCVWLIDARNWRNGTGFVFAFGKNALFAGIFAQVLYLLLLHASPVAQGEPARQWFFERMLSPWAGAVLGSLFFAVAILLLSWVPCRYLLTRNTGLKI